MTEREFKETVLCHYQVMFAQAMSVLCNRDEALDCIQDTVAILWVNRNRLSEMSDVRSYCIVSVLNNARKLLRTRKIMSDDQILDVIEEKEGDDSSDMMSMLQRGLSQMSETQRRILLFSAAGEKVADISEEVELSESNVRQLISRGRKKLKEFFKQK